MGGNSTLEVISDHIKEQAEAALLEGDVDLALHRFSSALKLDTHNHRLWSGRAECFLKAEKFEAALKDARRCVEICPTHLDGYRLAGKALESLGQVEKAREMFVTGINLSMKMESSSAAWRKTLNNPKMHGVHVERMATLMAALTKKHVEDLAATKGKRGKKMLAKFNEHQDAFIQDLVKTHKEDEEADSAEYDTLSDYFGAGGEPAEAAAPPGAEELVRAMENLLVDHGIAACAVDQFDGCNFGELLKKMGQDRPTRAAPEFQELVTLMVRPTIYRAAVQSEIALLEEAAAAQGEKRAHDDTDDDDYDEETDEEDTDDDDGIVPDAGRANPTAGTGAAQKQGLEKLLWSFGAIVGTGLPIFVLAVLHCFPFVLWALPQE